VAHKKALRLGHFFLGFSVTPDPVIKMAILEAAKPAIFPSN